MITKRQLAELIESKPSDQPLFASLDEMCEALGFDDETKASMRRDMEWTWQTRQPQWQFTGRGHFLPRCLRP